ncbi:hypothetical protein DDE05_55815 [Streptomyces cavourensis]|nr:hypothetical protein DDE05_55815 [Streptomyces cavourensis]
MYANGDDVAQDDAKAVRLMRQAATQGHRLATFSLGVMYAEGRGVARNLATALALISVVPSPDEEMMQYRDRLATDMAPSQRDDAEQLVNKLLTAGVTEETLRRADGQ